MSTSHRRKSVPVTQALVQAPHEYSFIQAVRLLQRSAVLRNSEDKQTATNPTAHFTPPATEAMRFLVNQSLSFPTSEVASISQASNPQGIKQFLLEMSFK